MSVEIAAQAAYIVAGLLFILALAGLSKHETAKTGNAFGMAGMAVALVATIGLALDRDIAAGGLALLIAATAVGAAIGLWRASASAMVAISATAIPAMPKVLPALDVSCLDSPASARMNSKAATM